MSALAEPVLLAIDLEEEIVHALSSLLKRENIVPTLGDIEKLTEPPLRHEPTLVVMGTSNQSQEVDHALEIAQLMRMHYPNCPILFTLLNRSGFDKKKLVKNGISEVFFFPLEKTDFVSKLRDELSLATQGTTKSYKAVKLLDLTAEEPLDFDTSVFLPMNKKYVRIGSSGERIDEAKLKKLNSQKVSEIFVEKSQMQKFYDYSARQLKNMGRSGVSETEKKEKLTSAIKGLMSGIFNDSSESETIDHGRELMGNCQEIVKSFIALDQKDSQNWYDTLMSKIGNSSESYSHPSHVSTLAALFSIGTGIGNPEEVAIAGLLHDIGLADLPFALQNKAETELTAEEWKEFAKHPELSLNLIKSRKINVSEKVQKMILQHHERYDGKGYPTGLAGTRLLPEAQIVALADLIETKTSPQPGKPRQSPWEAIREIRAEVAQNSELLRFDPKLLDQILKLFPA